MSELEFEWGEAAAPEPRIEKPRWEVPVQTWKFHRCEKNHKSAKTFMECALRKYTPNVSGKLTLPSISVRGEGNWACIHELASDSYYTTHNNREINHQHRILEVSLFETMEEAHSYYLSQDYYCDGPGRHSPRCVGMWDNIIRVKN